MRNTRCFQRYRFGNCSHDRLPTINTENIEEDRLVLGNLVDSQATGIRVLMMLAMGQVFIFVIGEVINRETNCLLDE